MFLSETLSAANLRTKKILNIIFNPILTRASLVAPLVENLPAVWETWIQPLDWEDHLQEGMQPTPVFLPRASPWTGEPGGMQSMGSQRVRQD